MSTDNCVVVETAIEIGVEGYISIIAMSYINEWE